MLGGTHLACAMHVERQELDSLEHARDLTAQKSMASVWGKPAGVWLNPWGSRRDLHFKGYSHGPYGRFRK